MVYDSDEFIQAVNLFFVIFSHNNGSLIYFVYEISYVVNRETDCHYLFTTNVNDHRIPSFLYIMKTFTGFL